MHYALPHEDFVWRIRSEPGVISAWEKDYNDSDLIYFPFPFLAPPIHAPAYQMYEGSLLTKIQRRLIRRLEFRLPKPHRPPTRHALATPRPKPPQKASNVSKAS